MQISWIMQTFGKGGGGRDFRGIVKAPVCRIKARARMDTSGAT